MLTRCRQIVSLLLLTGLLSQAACLNKHQIKATSDGFRLESVKEDFLLMTPPLPAVQPVNKPMKIRSKMFSSTSDHLSECRAEMGAFKIEPQSGSSSIQIELPTPDQWMTDLEGRSEVGSRSDFESLYRFLGEIDELQTRECFTSETVETLRDFIMQILPSRPNEAPFMSYSHFGGLDLHPGMRLKIERAYFRHVGEAKGESDDLRDFQGVSTNYFDLESADADRVRVRKVGNTQYSSAAVAEVAKEDLQDLQLRSISEPLKFRLLFYNYLVPQQKRISAAIIGAPTIDRLNDLEEKVQSDSESPCKQIGVNIGSLCMRFEGFVTVIPQFRIIVNGSERFVDWGIKLKNVLPDRSQTKKLRSLRIRRKFMNRYYDLNFDRRDSNILSLWLLDGDDLTW
jgi:hypothetical protein